MASPRGVLPMQFQLYILARHVVPSRLSSREPVGVTKQPYAGVVELADTPDLGSGAVRFGGSSPPSRTLRYSVALQMLL